MAVQPLSPSGAESPSSLTKVILGAAIGTMIEWYDFYIFGALTAVLAVKFYPPGNDTFALIAYLATFAIGFVVRPFGAIFFGRIGDVIGRRVAFIVTLAIMGFATSAIGLLPTFHTAGWFAPVALILIRLLQGLAIGGEYGGAAVYVAEHVPENKRGYYTSYIQVTALLGMFISLAADTAKHERRKFQQWGWRLPFLASLILVVLSLYVRVRMKESPLFLQLKSAGMHIEVVRWSRTGRSQSLYVRSKETGDDLVPIAGARGRPPRTSHNKGMTGDDLQSPEIGFAHSPPL